MDLASIYILDDGAGDINLAFLVLRVIGLMFAAHGAQKLFGWFDGKGMDGQIAMTTNMGMKAPVAQAWTSAIFEFVGGLLLFVGFLTPLGAAMVIGEMTVAIVIVHWKNGFFAGKGGIEFPLMICIVAFFLAVLGPGEWSLDNWFGISTTDGFYEPWGLGWGLIAAVLAVVGGLIVNATREPKS